jgi:RimJ/RimL family protein N-acetyltransferase
VTPHIVGSLLFGADQEVANLVSSRIPQMMGARFVEPFHAVGVVRNGALVGGVVFYNKRFNGSALVDIEMSAAFEPTDWCRPSTLKALFEVPFVHLNSSRMTTITSRKNKPARLIDEGLGFKLEGVHPEAIDGKQDAVSYGMLRKNCVWIDPARRGEAIEMLRRVREKWKK